MEIAAKYRLVRLLGEGGMGAVWLARNVLLDVDVALKLIHRELAVPDAPARLLQEARVAAQLGHRSIVRVFDFGETDYGDPFIVMEVLDGVSLASMLERSSRMAATEIVRMVLPVADALSAAHARGVVHCDVKPENIVLVSDANTVVPKLVDFGVAKFLRPGPGAGLEVNGTPKYMSPEQVHGRDALDGRTDVWSLSVVLYQAVAGRCPFTGTNTNAELAAVLVHAPEPTTQHGGGDESLWEIIARGLAKDRNERWPTMAAFGRALAHWTRESGFDTEVTGTSLAEQWPEQGSRSSTASARSSTALARSSAPPRVVPSPARQEGEPHLPRSDSAPAPIRRPRRRGRRVVLVLALGMLAAAVGTARVRGFGRTELELAAGAAWLSNQAFGRTPPEPAVAAATASAPPSAASPTPEAPSSPVPAASDPAEDADAGATAAEAAGKAAGACAQPLLMDAFDPTQPLDLSRLCIETDTRRGAGQVRAEVIRASHGGPATQAMREWAVLGWYELAALEVLRARCCLDPAPVTLPAPTGSCGSVPNALDDLRLAVRAGRDTAAPISRFRAAADCHARSGWGSAYTYSRPQSGEAEVLRKLLVRAAATVVAGAAPVPRRGPRTAPGAKQLPAPGSMSPSPPADSASEPYSTR